MFDFEEPEDGSEERYAQRQETWRSHAKSLDEIEAEMAGAKPININPHNLPLVKHHFWWLLHNLVAHPAIGLVPVRATFDFHDWTSRKLNGQ